VPAGIVIGCGYTGARVASALLDRGERVIATTRHAEALAGLAARGALVLGVEAGDDRSLAALRRATAEPGARVLVSVPPLPGPPPADPVAALLAALGAPPSRVVYLSTSAVYGRAEVVDERTPAAPGDAAGEARLAAEAAVRAGPWSALVLRPAAIYGAWRGLHATLRDGGRPRSPDPDRVVSRIHVDDLAALAVAALDAPVEGAFPVADEEPASGREVARFCESLGLPGLAAPGPREPGGRPGRRVDGRAILALLGLRLRHPSFRSGIPAALAAEAAGRPGRPG
jgi:nucleoside-diphosphate-sugar epimerase